MSTFEAAFEAKVRPVIERIEHETGQNFHDWYQPIQGELVEEFTDIRWATIQTLVHWANDTGADFQTCAREFMKSFLEEVQRLGKKNWPAAEDLRTNCPCGSGQPYGDCSDKDCCLECPTCVCTANCKHHAGRERCGDPLPDSAKLRLDGSWNFCEVCLKNSYTEAAKHFKRYSGEPVY